MSGELPARTINQSQVQRSTIDQILNTRRSTTRIPPLTHPLHLLQCRPPRHPTPRRTRHGIHRRHWVRSQRTHSARKHHEPQVHASKSRTVEKETWRLVRKVEVRPHPFHKKQEYQHRSHDHNRRNNNCPNHRSALPRSDLQPSIEIQNTHKSGGKERHSVWASNRKNSESNMGLRIQVPTETLHGSHCTTNGLRSRHMASPRRQNCPYISATQQILDSAATSHESNNRMFPNDTNDGTRKSNKSTTSNTSATTESIKRNHKNANTSPTTPTAQMAVTSSEERRGPPIPNQPRKHRQILPRIHARSRNHPSVHQTTMVDPQSHYSHRRKQRSLRKVPPTKYRLKPDRGLTHLHRRIRNQARNRGCNVLLHKPTRRTTIPGI